MAPEGGEVGQLDLGLSLAASQLYCSGAGPLDSVSSSKNIEKKNTPISRDPLEVTQEDSMGLGVGTSRGRLRPSAPRAAILWGLAASFCARGGLPISEFWSTDVPKG